MNLRSKDFPEHVHWIRKADKWVLVGYFKTEYEASTAYEKARNEQAVLHNTTVDRMYEKIIFLRPCGHYAVESKVKHLGNNNLYVNCVK